jgi:hypothetical protein
MFGWHTPSANPNNYNEDGTFKKDVIWLLTNVINYAIIEE